MNKKLSNINTSKGIKVKSKKHHVYGKSRYGHQYASKKKSDKTKLLKRKTINNWTIYYPVLVILIIFGLYLYFYILNSTKFE